MKEREKIRYRLSINHLSFAWLIDMLRKRGIDWYERQIGGVS